MGTYQNAPLYPVPQRRSASGGVITAAIVALLGSGFSVLINLVSLIAILAMGFALPEKEAMPFAAKTFLALIYGCMIALSAFGVATAIGLLRLRNWARIATIVWGAMLIVIGAFTVLILVVMPAIPTPADALQNMDNIMTMVRVIGGCFWGLIASIGIWWIVFFSRKATREQFVAPALAAVVLPPPGEMPASAVQPPPPPGASLQAPVAPPVIPAVATAQPVEKKPQAPAPIIAVACLLLLSLPSLLMLPFFPMPLMMFGHLFHGGAAKLIMAALAAINAVAGIALLRLKPWGYYVALLSQILIVINGIVTLFDPHLEEKFREIMPSMPQFPAPPGMPDFTSAMIPFMRLGMTLGMLFPIVMLGLLVFYRRPFMDAARRAIGKSATAPVANA